MNTSRSVLSLLLIITASAIGITSAQPPAPIVVQAANAPATQTAVITKPTAAAADDQSVDSAIKLLQQIKAANDEVLAKQKAALERLDELKESADQLQIFAKRG